MVSVCGWELNAHIYSAASLKYHAPDWLIVLGFNDTSTHEGHFCVVSQRKGEKR